MTPALFFVVTILSAGPLCCTGLRVLPPDQPFDAEPLQSAQETAAPVFEASASNADDAGRPPAAPAVQAGVADRPTSKLPGSLAQAGGRRAAQSDAFQVRYTIVQKSETVTPETLYSERTPSNSGFGMHLESFRELTSEAIKDPFSAKAIPFYISIGLALTIVCCICCSCFAGKRAGPPAKADGGRRRNNRFATDSDGPRLTVPGSGDKRHRLSSPRRGTEQGKGVDPEEAKRLAEAKLLEEIEELVEKTSRTVQKYPKSGRSMFKKDRHVAPKPAPERAGTSTAKQKVAARIIQRWRQGTFGWWESEEAMKQGLDPKGSLDLMAIIKVQVYKDEKSGRGVVVKYNAPNDRDEMEPQEMILMFPTKRDAEEWGYAFWNFLSKLRTRVSDGAFLNRDSVAQRDRTSTSPPRGGRDSAPSRSPRPSEERESGRGASQRRDDGHARASNYSVH